MKMRSAILSALLLAGLLLELGTAFGSASKTGGKDAAPAASSATTASATPSAQEEDLRMEGEKRFRSNCARCHTAPPKFAPRMMATIVRHMRVRANITDQDMRLILRYMTE